MSSPAIRQIGGTANWRCGSACGLSKSSGADFSVAAHTHVPTSSLRSVVGPGVSTRSRRSVEMTRGWSVDVNEFGNQKTYLIMHGRELPGIPGWLAALVRKHRGGFRDRTGGNS